ncbi:aromatic ring-hydroxylating oxygenase subunit alpha [Paracoccus cavernae]|uniref:aromatic ring-hydroxylating oxygenase subunit alpha n=1 Tax=Paracoccus cavernae TaxID=1571207 RepID=UPI0036305DB5
MSQASPLAELLAAAARPMVDARAMPPSVYTSTDFLDLELSEIFGKEWVCVGHASGLPNVGDYLTFDLAGQPIVVIRDREQGIRAFSNVCLHRMSTLVEGTGNKRVLVCPYHAWTYGLDGQLRGAPFMAETTGFCKENYKLPAIRCEEWKGWIYVTLDNDRPSLASGLGELDAMIAPYEVENYQECFRETHVWDTNWKVLAENFMESYHLPVCHADTVGGHSKLEEMDCPPASRPSTITGSPKRRPCRWATPIPTTPA